MWGKLGLIVVLCLAPFAAKADLYDRGRDSMVFLEFKDLGVTCTGQIALHRRAVLTASHCIEVPIFPNLPFRMQVHKGKVVVSGVETNYTLAYSDGNDHVFLVVDQAPTRRVAKIAKRPLKIGEWAYLWGNPQGARDILRVGRYQGKREAPLVAPMLHFGMNTGPGDSGGAYYNMRNEIVTINYGYSLAIYGTSVGMPLAFTETQYRALKALPR